MHQRQVTPSRGWDAEAEVKIKKERKKDCVCCVMCGLGYTLELDCDRPCTGLGTKKNELTVPHPRTNQTAAKPRMDVSLRLRRESVSEYRNIRVANIFISRRA